VNAALLRYLVRRLLIAIPQVLIITSAVFVLIRMLPADPATRVVGIVTTPDAYRQARHSLGIDKSLPEQYWIFLQGLLHGDLGRSWVSGDPVLTEIRLHFPITLQLIVLGFLFALAISVPMGMLSAINPKGKLSRGVFAYGLFAGAQPDFWWGLMFVFLFVFTIPLFPAPIGLLSRDVAVPPSITGFNLVDSLLGGRFDAFVSIVSHYLLPSLTMAFVLTGPIVKMIRQNMIRILDSDFIIYARAAGLSRRKVASYTLHNALTPVVTLVGILFGFVLGGAVLIETVFSLNGLGQYAVQRTLALDYPAIQGVVMVMTAFALVVYLLMDILYALIDPRIRY
jgi:ABC-type dipeptide/oligopeptide/nickel transport system permease component